MRYDSAACRAAIVHHPFRRVPQETVAVAWSTLHLQATTAGGRRLPVSVAVQRISWAEAPGRAAREAAQRARVEESMLDHLDRPRTGLPGQRGYFRLVWLEPAG